MLKGEAQTVSADAVGVDAALPRVVLFDFDGVLMHGDAFYLFMRERYRRSWWRPLLALLSTPLLLLQLPFSRRLPARVLVCIALLGLGERHYQAAANAFAASLARRPRSSTAARSGAAPRSPAACAARRHSRWAASC